MQRTILTLASLLVLLAGTRAHAGGTVISVGTTAAYAGDAFVLPVLADWQGALQGFSLSLQIPVVHPISGLDLTVADTIVGALHPDFLAVNFFPGEVVLGLLFDSFPPFDGTTLAPIGIPLAIAEFRGTVQAGTPAQTLAFAPVDGLGQPPTNNHFVINHQSIPPTSLEGGSLTILPPVGNPTPVFIRGDSYVDNFIDISDIIYTLMFIFAQGPTPLCMAAADANNDSTINVADPIFMLQYLFLSGASPPAPFPAPGPDPNPNGLSCNAWVGMP